MTESRPNESREEMANREVGRTEISPAVARVLVWSFLAVGLSIAPLQALIDLPETPFALSIFRAPGRALEAFRTGALAGREPSGDAAPSFLRRVKLANDQLLIEIHDYEDTQKDEEHSFLTAALVTPVQAFTTRRLGHGNEQGYPGRDGWAFFRDGVESLTGPGFLEPAQLARRAAGGSEWVAAPQPDPLPAIVAFHQYLGSRGIRLVMMPVPVKPTVHPERLSPRYDPGDGPIRNPSFGPWLQALEAAGVAVFDPAPLLVEAKKEGPQYLETDTHWRPDAMERTADALAAFLSSLDLLPDRPSAGYRRGSAEVSALGDVAANLLKLDGTDVFEKQTVITHPVKDRDDSPWASDPGADVLVLGDSFANIYAATNLEWGAEAGLAEQLSVELQRPVDRISQNDGGSFAACRDLESALRKGDRLAGKKVVIWEFAARELAVGDWQLIDWESIPIGAATTAAITMPGGVPVQGSIRQVTRPPQPGTVTYKDCIVEVHLAGITGDIPEKEAVVYLLGMRDNKWTPAASLQAGDPVNLHLTDWATASADPALATMRHEPLDDPDLELILLPEFWGELERGSE